LFSRLKICHSAATVGRKLEKKISNLNAIIALEQKENREISQPFHLLNCSFTSVHTAG
jgi:hypothetical protein